MSYMVTVYEIQVGIDEAYRLFIHLFVLFVMLYLFFNGRFAWTKSLSLRYWYKNVLANHCKLFSQRSFQVSFNYKHRLWRLNITRNCTTTYLVLNVLIFIPSYHLILSSYLINLTNYGIRNYSIFFVRRCCKFPISEAKVAPVLRIGLLQPLSVDTVTKAVGQKWQPHVAKGD